MDDFFESLETEKHASRADRLRREKGKRRRRLIIILTSSLVSVAVVSLAAWFMLQGQFPAVIASEPKKAEKKQSKVVVKAEIEQAEVQEEPVEEEEVKGSPVTIKQTINILVIGVEEAGGRKKARGLLLAKLDFQEPAIKAVNIPDKMYLNIPGLGLDQISESFATGASSTRKAVEELLQVPIENYVVIQHSDFEFLVNENRFRIAFDKAIETGFFAAEKTAYAEEVAKVATAKVDIIPLPVKFVSVNGEPYYEPNNEEVNRLLEAIWGIKREVRTEITRVIILNGSGKPGVGREISQRLTANGFMVSDVKNASSFNYNKTQIVVYKEEFIEKGRTIQQILGVGDVATRLVTQDVAEIAIIVGKDYGSTN